MAIEQGTYSKSALAEAREIMIDMSTRAGDPLAEYRGAGIVVDGKRFDTQINAVRADGTLVHLSGISVAVGEQGEQTMFAPNWVHAKDFVELFPGRERRVR